MASERQLTVTAVDFMRTAKSKPERGVQINDSWLLIDIAGRVLRVQDIWSFTQRPAVFQGVVPDVTE